METSVDVTPLLEGVFNWPKLKTTLKHFIIKFAVGRDKKSLGFLWVNF